MQFPEGEYHAHLEVQLPSMGVRVARKGHTLAVEACDGWKATEVVTLPHPAFPRRADVPVHTVLHRISTRFYPERPPVHCSTG